MGDLIILIDRREQNDYPPRLRVMDTTIRRYVAILCAVLLCPGNLLWADPDPDTAAPAEASAPSQASAPAQNFTPDQINSLVAPIALYPDELVSQILVASTYPLE